MENSNAGKNGYLARYKNKEVEVWTNEGIYKAQCEAQKLLGAKKSYEVSIALCVRADGSEVIHTAC